MYSDGVVIKRNVVDNYGYAVGCCFAAPVHFLLQSYALSVFIVDVCAKFLHGVGWFYHQDCLLHSFTSSSSASSLIGKLRRTLLRPMNHLQWRIKRQLLTTI